MSDYFMSKNLGFFSISSIEISLYYVGKNESGYGAFGRSDLCGKVSGSPITKNQRWSNGRTSWISNYVFKVFTFRPEPFNTLQK